LVFNIDIRFFKYFNLIGVITLLQEDKKHLFVAAYAIIETKMVIVIVSPSA